MTPEARRAVAELNRYKEGFWLRDVSTDAAMRLTDRLGLMEGGVSVWNVPIGGQTNAEKIPFFWQNAVNGFLIFVNTAKDKKIDATQAFGAKSADKAIEQVGALATVVKKDPMQKIDEYALPVFAHVLATLIILRQQYHVSLDSLGSYHGLKLGQTRRAITFWTEPLTDNMVWQKMSRIRNGAQDGIFAQGQVANPRWVMEAAHFFAAGENLAQSVFKPVWEKHAPIAFGALNG